MTPHSSNTRPQPSLAFPVPAGARILAFLPLLLLLCACKPPSSGGASGADYPNRTVRIICPWAAGGGTDRMARFLAGQLDRGFQNPFVVVNTTGGSGASGHTAGALARPDGYTLTMATFELSTMHWMGICDLTHEDFTPVMQLNADAAAIVVHADAPWNTLAGFLDHVRANPGRVRMSGTETGGAWDLARAGFLLAAQLPVESITWSPERGAAPSIVKLLGKHIEAVCCSIPEASTQVEAGQLKFLAVMSDQRHPQFPAVPTALESGINWTAVGWRGLMLPKETPGEITRAIALQCEAIAASDTFREFMEKNGFTIQTRDSAAFTQFLKDQDAQWKQVIEAAGYARQ